MAKTLSLLLLFLELTFLIAFAEEINSLPQTYSPRYPPHHHHTSPSIAPAHVHNPLHPLLPAKPPTPHHPPAHAPIRPPASAPRQPPAHAPIHPPANTPRHPPAHALIRPPANAPQRPPAHAPIRPPASAPHHHHQSPSPAPTHHHHHHHHSPSPAPTHPHRHHHHHHDSPSHHHHHAHAPNHTPRSFIVVKGVVYVKSCEHARSDTLLDSTKLFGLSFNLSPLLLLSSKEKSHTLFFMRFFLQSSVYLFINIIYISFSRFF